ncbi:MAG: DIE2/ALG10 family-domain-containing protein [Monoraphidium minutum]|nr:MAG: DIE2/ALG10 family-domain-containing protein [Monoraphidium minutum]
MLAVVAGSHPGPPPARPQGAIGAARGGAGAALGAAERGARAPCNSWSVRSASCQGLVPPSIASGARCDGIDRGCKGQQQRGAEAVRKATKEANAGVTGERYMWRQRAARLPEVISGAERLLGNGRASLNGIKGLSTLYYLGLLCGRSACGGLRARRRASRRGPHGDMYGVRPRLSLICQLSRLLCLYKASRWPAGHASFQHPVYQNCVHVGQANSRSHGKKRGRGAMGGPPRHPAAWMPAGWSVGILSVLLVVVSAVNRVVPEPYMDEPFHVPAAQRYCAGNYATWDPKITTFPGLYAAGAAYARAAAALLGWAGVTLAATCSAPYLRSLNALLALAGMQLAHAVSYELQRRRWAAAAGGGGGGGRAPPAAAEAAMRRGALGAALVAGLLPTQAFFAGLFYTDTGAMAALLAAQLALLRPAGRGPAWGAAAAAAAAVGMRQTNAVWVGLMVGGTMLEELGLPPPGGGHAAGGGGGKGGGGDSKGSEGGSKSGGGSEGGSKSGSGVRTRRRGAAAAADGDGSGGGCGCALADELAAALPRAWAARGALAARFCPPLLVPAAFGAFVVWNGGVTVGDREAHAPVAHWAQPLYFGSFALATLGPLLASPAASGGAESLVAAARARPAREAAWWAAAAAAGAAAVVRGSLAHPYLIADNRHYTFYLWRRVLGRGAAARLALLPAHLLGWRLLGHGLAAAQRPLWVAAYCAAVAVTLVPAGLLELRYFTPAATLGLLHAYMPATGGGGGGGGGRGRRRGGGGGGGGGTGGGAFPWDAAALGATLAGYAAVNGAALWLFLARPFTWPDGSTARFMW